MWGWRGGRHWPPPHLAHHFLSGQPLPASPILGSGTGWTLCPPPSEVREKRDAKHLLSLWVEGRPGGQHSPSGCIPRLSPNATARGTQAPLAGVTLRQNWASGSVGTACWLLLPRGQLHSGTVLLETSRAFFLESSPLYFLDSLSAETEMSSVTCCNPLGKPSPPGPCLKHRRGAG